MAMSDKNAPTPVTKLEIDWDFIERAMPSSPSLAGQRLEGAKPARKKKPAKTRMEGKSAAPFPPDRYPGMTRTETGWALCHHGDGEVGFPMIEPAEADPAMSLSDLEVKAALMKLRLEPYRANAVDGDNDGIVQEHTAWERPAGTRLIDAAGTAIKEGLTAHRRPVGLQVVDADGNTVDYTPTYEPKMKPVAGVISRAPQKIGRTIGEMSSSEALTKLSAREPDEYDQIEAVDLWLTGTTKPLRKYLTDILEGPQTFDEAQDQALGGVKVPSMELLFKTRYARYRRSMAALMNLIAEGDIHDADKKPLYRGYYLQAPPEQALEMLKAGSKHDFPVRSFSETLGTALGFTDQRKDQRPGGTEVVFELTGDVQTASLHQWGMAMREKMRAEADPEMLRELTVDERIGYPFSRDGYEFLSGEEEHLVMGTFEVVNVQWDEDLDRMVVKIKQVSTLGLPEGGGKWR